MAASPEFEPRVIVFCCNWCAYAGADLAGASGRTYTYEPAPAVLLDTVVPHFTQLQVFQSVLEGLASEHSARMVAMGNATRNAAELIDTLIKLRHIAHERIHK
mgnify:CR=1 FL=1